ncbi:MAG: chloride channel protein [Christensenella sp.]|nr:chloride channel protein [Christensenella sp.]
MWEDKKKTLYQKAGHWKQRLISFCKWILLSAVIGAVIGGLVGTLFYYVMQWANITCDANWWLVLFLPAGGLFIVWLYRICGVKKSRGTDLVFLAVRSSKRVPMRMAPLIFISTAITHLFGGSAGRESAALQIGGSLGYGAGKFLKLEEKSLHVATMCGMAAVFSALFGMPVVATVFVLEVVSVGQMHYSALVPVSVSSLLSAGIAAQLGAVAPHFEMTMMQGISLIPALQTAALAALCAVVCILFCRALQFSGKLYEKLLPNPYLRVLAGGALVMCLMLLSGTNDYEGAGSHVIASALGGTAKPEAFALKLILTALTIGAGFKGGEIIPSFFIGATFGCWMGGLLGLDPAFGAAIGLICLFCGVVNCPISALVLGCSLFGASGILYFLLACAISYALSGYSSLYSEQKILYSKFHPRYINKKTE